MAGKPPAAIGDNLTQVRANREKALFSHIWNFAREQGLPKSPNPCTGIRGFREQGRDVVISDEVVERMFAHASQPRQFALRLAHHTGQRPADVLRMSESHISQGLLHARQGKTAVKLRIEVSGALAELLAEIQAYKSQFKVRALSLLVNEAGLSMSQHMLRDRFDAAREAAGIPKP